VKQEDNAPCDSTPPSQGAKQTDPSRSGFHAGSGKADRRGARATPDRCRAGGTRQAVVSDWPRHGPCRATPGGWRRWVKAEPGHKWATPDPQPGLALTD